MGHWRKIIVSGSNAELNKVTISDPSNPSVVLDSSGITVGSAFPEGTAIVGGDITTKAINVATNLIVTGSIIGTAATASTIQITGSSTSANFPIIFASQTASNGISLFADDNITINPSVNQLTVGSGAIVVGNTTIGSGFTTFGGVSEVRMSGSVSSSISSSNDLFVKVGPGTNTRFRISASGQMALGPLTNFSTNVLLSITTVPGAIYTAAPANTSAFGIYNNITWSGSTAGVANILNYASYARTTVGTTLTNFYNFRVEENQFFGSSSNMYGYYCGPIPSARSASFGFYGLVNSSSIGATNYNIFMQGDAPNYLRGTLFVGNISSSAPREMVYIRPTGSLITAALRVQNSASVDLFVVGGGTGGTNTVTISGSTSFSILTTASFQGIINIATSSTAPITGVEGDFRVAQSGSSYFIYAYIGGRWRSSSLV